MVFVFRFAVPPPKAGAGDFGILAGFEKCGAVGVAKGEDAREGGLCVGLYVIGGHGTKKSRAKRAARMSQAARVRRAR